MQNVWKGMKKIPEEVYAIIAFLFIFSETARSLTKQSGEFILKQVKELIDGVKKFIEYIISLLKEMYENLKPLGTVVFQLISSMLLSAGIMYDEIQENGKLSLDFARKPYLPTAPFRELTGRQRPVRAPQDAASRPATV